MNRAQSDALLQTEAGWLTAHNAIIAKIVKKGLNGLGELDCIALTEMLQIGIVTQEHIDRAENKHGYTRMFGRVFLTLASKHACPNLQINIAYWFMRFLTRHANYEPTWPDVMPAIAATYILVMDHYRTNRFERSCERINPKGLDIFRAQRIYELWMGHAALYDSNHTTVDMLTEEDKKLQAFLEENQLDA